MNAKRLSLATLLGGLTVFAWGAISWTVLPWHHLTMSALSNEAAVAPLLAAGADGRGIYVVPAFAEHGGASTDAADWARRHEAGPVAFLAVVPDGAQPMAPSIFAMGFVLACVGALVAAVLLSVAAPRLPSYPARVLFVVGLGAFGSLGALYDWNYFYFATDYSLVMVADVLLTWLLGGLVLAALVKPDRPRTAEAPVGAALA